MGRTTRDAPLDLALATPGNWLVIPHQQTMHDGSRHQTFAVLATGANVTEQFVGRAHPMDGRPEDLPTVRMNARLFAASKEMAALLIELVAYQSDQFDGAEHLDLEVSGADTVDWLTDFRLRVRAVIGTVAGGDQP